MKKILLGLMGLVVLIAGLSLILRFWGEITMIFKGVIGILLAIAGLVMMTVARD